MAEQPLVVPRAPLGKLLGSVVATAICLVPALGLTWIPPFSNVLLLYPQSMRLLAVVVIPIFIGVIGTFVSWRGLLARRLLKNKTGRIIRLAFLTGALAVLTVMLYLSAVTRIPVGDNTVRAYVTGFGSRPPSCECPPSISNEECINQYTTHRSDAIASCFGDDRIHVAEMVLFLFYAMTLACVLAIGAILPWSEPSSRESRMASAMDTKQVFLVHGRDLVVRNWFSQFLSHVGLSAHEFTEAIAATGKASPSLTEILDVIFETAPAVVILLTGDDIVSLREGLVLPDDSQDERSPMPQARPNVIFEAGMAWGRQPEKTIFVEIGKLKLFSDISGIHKVDFDGSPEQRQELVTRLKVAGCTPITENRKEWLSIPWVGIGARRTE